MSKKPVLFYTIADSANLPMALNCEKSFKSFHADVPFKIVQGEELQGYLKTDPAFFYRATPILTEKYLQEYELVVKIDADSLVLGDISYIWKTLDYDIATVLNFNKLDPMTYGYVDIQRIGITPVDYFNCGLVAIRNPKFAHHWKVKCFDPEFDKVQYREQDIMNVLCYYGNYSVRCLDHGDPIGGNIGWWGLIGKSRWKDAIVVGKKIIVKDIGDKFPARDTELKIVHMGTGPNKASWAIYFNSEVMSRIQEIIK